MPIPPFITRDEFTVPKPTNEVPMTALSLPEPEFPSRAVQDSSTQRERQFEAHTERHRRQIRRETFLEVNSSPVLASSEVPVSEQVVSDSTGLLERMAMTEIGPRSAYQERLLGRRRQRLSSPPPPSSYRRPRGFADFREPTPSPASHEGNTDGFPYYPRSPADFQAAIGVSRAKVLATTVAVRRIMNPPVSLGLREEFDSTSRRAPRIVPPSLHEGPVRMYRSEQIVADSDSESDVEDSYYDDDEDELAVDLDVDSLDYASPPTSQYVIVNRPSQALLACNFSLVPGAPLGWGRRPPQNPTQEIRRIQDDPPKEPHVTWAQAPSSPRRVVRMPAAPRLEGRPGLPYDQVISEQAPWENLPMPANRW